MIKKLLMISVFFAISFTATAFAQNCTGNKVPCCPSGQKSCCSPLHCDPYSGPCQTYDISCWNVAVPVCPDGQQYINGKCQSLIACLVGQTLINGECVNNEVEVKLGCSAFVSEAGHSVPETSRGVSVSMGCYTYSCSSLAVWSTTSNCQCKPGLTYYEPCDDCGTRSRTCTQSGTFSEWSACAAL